MIAVAATLMCAAPAFADVLTFDTAPAATYDSGASIQESGYNLLFVEGPVAASFGYSGATGAIIDSTNPFSCDIIGCPTGANGNYLAILNDGAVTLSNAGPLSGFRITGLNFSFITPAPVPPGDYGQLRLAGVNWQGQSVSASFAFPGQDANGNFSFGAADLSAVFGANVFSSLTLSACLYDVDNVCSNSVDSPAFNQAQFAIDDLAVTAVPEPASFLLAGLGLGLLGLARRRTTRSTSL